MILAAKSMEEAVLICPSTTNACSKEYWDEEYTIDAHRHLLIDACMGHEVFVKQNRILDSGRRTRRYMVS
jgi:hypothetical protein